MSNTKRIEYPVSKIDKLINKLSQNSTCETRETSDKRPLIMKNSICETRETSDERLSFMQNEPNFKITRNDISTCIINTYGNLIAFFRPKNEAKRTQNEPNISPKLASFLPIKANFKAIQTQPVVSLSNLFHPNGKCRSGGLTEWTGKLCRLFFYSIALISSINFLISFKIFSLLSKLSSMILMIFEPIMTPSAPAEAMAAACSGLLMPKPTHTGTCVNDFSLAMRERTSSESFSLLPVTPKRETA